MHIVPIAPDIDSSLAIREDDIRRIFSPATLSAGRSYEQRGRVQSLEIEERGALITATTQGTRPDPYVQSLKVSRSPNQGIRIAGACSCPVGRGCKHLAAVLIATQRREIRVPRHQEALSARASKVPPPAVLPTQIQTWLADFDRDDEEPTEDYPASLRTRVFYVLDAAPNATGVPSLRIDPMTVTLRKDNSPGTIKRYAPHQIRTPAKYIRPSDLVILTRLSRLGGYAGPQADDDPLDTLHRILGTGRARWGSAEGPALSDGPERQGQITWITRPDASQQATLSLDEGLVGVRIPAPWYVEPCAGIMGPVALDLPYRVVARLLNAPSIPPEAAAEVRAQLSRRMPSAKVPVPAELRPPEAIQETMRPHLRLISGTLPSDPSYGRGSARVLGRGLYAVPLVRLSYQYGRITLPRTLKPQPRIIVQDGTLYEVERDRAAETRALLELTGLGFGSVHEVVPVYYQHAHTDDFALRELGANPTWLQIVTEQVPRLRRDGWTIDFDEDFPLQVLSADTDIEAELIQGSGIDWLELHLGVTVDGEQVDLVPALIRLIARPEAAELVEGSDDKPFVLPLLDGRLLSLPMSRIRPTLQALLELWAGGGIDPEGGRIGFSRADAADLAELEERTGLVWRGGDALRELGRTLRQSGGIPKTAIPDAFLATLRPYQGQGVDWLQFLASAGLGGVLADDMGLGKTVQTLAHLMIEKAAGRLDRPCLIVCPTSLIPNWLAEARRFAPELSVLSLHGAARKARFSAIATHDLVLSTYPLLTRDHAVLLEQEWHAVILDEAQSIKNPNAETTRQALRLKARQRLCLSGNAVAEPLRRVVVAVRLPGARVPWRSTIVQDPVQNTDRKTWRRRAASSADTPAFVRSCCGGRRKRSSPNCRRRPRSSSRWRWRPTSGAIYEAIRLSMHTKVQAAIAQKGLARSGIIILDALLKMRQACCDPRLLKLKTVAKSKAGSAKLDRLMEMLSIMFAEGRRVLLFSQFTEMLALIQRRLEDDGVSFVKLTGDTRDRATPVQAFQAGDVSLFLISLKAGGVGLNLTAADTVIHYDPWWNPAVEDQATDRAHRIGQTKKVFVHRLVTLGTIEEKMEVLKDKKARHRRQRDGCRTWRGAQSDRGGH